MSIEDQARMEAEERYPMDYNGSMISRIVREAKQDGYAQRIIDESTKERPWIHEIIDAAVESFDLGPEDQDCVLRFGMKLQDMEDAERKPQPSVEEVMEVIMQWLSERSSLTGELRDRLTTLLNTSAAMAEVEQCQAKG